MKVLFQKRDIKGRKSRKLRGQGLVPVVCYGPGEENVLASVAYQDVVNAMRSENVVIETSGDIVGKQVLIQDIDRDPVSGALRHVDFLFINARQEVEHDVPIHAEGESPAVRLHNGQMVIALDRVEVRALPKDLPKSIAVDLSALTETGMHVTAGDVALPEGVTLVTDPESIIISIVEQVEEKEDLAEEVPDFENMEATGERGTKTKEEQEAEATSGSQDDGN